MSISNKHNGEMSHVAMAVLAIAAVVLAGLGLIVVSRHAHDHPGAVFGLMIGGLTLIALVIIVARRRGEHT